MADLRVCVVCGKEFYDRTKCHSKITCSVKCRNTHYFQDDKKQLDRTVYIRLHIMKQKYGVTFDKQTVKRIKSDLMQGKCMVCGRERQENERDFHIDHDHITGEYRGIVCPSHNSALGYVNDSPIEAAQVCKYLIAKKSKGINYADELWLMAIVNELNSVVSSLGVN